MAWVRVRMPVMQAFTGAGTGVVFPNRCVYCFVLGQGSLGFLPRLHMRGGRSVSTGSLTLKFTNPNYASAFVQANPGALKPG
jgi:hypothetical protein